MLKHLDDIKFGKLQGEEDKMQIYMKTEWEFKLWDFIEYGYRWADGKKFEEFTL